MKSFCKRARPSENTAFGFSTSDLSAWKRNLEQIQGGCIEQHCTSQARESFHTLSCLCQEESCYWAALIIMNLGCEGKGGGRSWLSALPWSANSVQVRPACLSPARSGFTAPPPPRPLPAPSFTSAQVLNLNHQEEPSQQVTQLCEGMVLAYSGFQQL